MKEETKSEREREVGETKRDGETKGMREREKRLKRKSERYKKRKIKRQKRLFER